MKPTPFTVEIIGSKNPDEAMCIFAITYLLSSYSKGLSRLHKLHGQPATGVQSSKRVEILLGLLGNWHSV
jgi:hypothetical protein